jgi:hypothetical protein
MIINNEFRWISSKSFTAILDMKLEKFLQNINENALIWTISRNKSIFIKNPSELDGPSNLDADFFTDEEHVTFPCQAILNEPSSTLSIHRRHSLNM